MTKELYVQYGCGLEAPLSWINFDSSPNLKLERLPIIGKLYTGKKELESGVVRMRFPSHINYGDIVKGLPIKANSCSGVYASHVLEHLSLEDFRKALGNTYKILEPGGIFRLVVPDLKVMAQRYLENEQDNAAISFLNSTGLGTYQRPKGLKNYIFSFFSNSKHLWMWDYLGIEKELKRKGFVSIRRAEFNDSCNKRFIEVESRERFIDSVAVECKKPLK